MYISHVLIIAPTSADSYTLDAMCWDLSERWNNDVTWRWQRDYRKDWTARFTDDEGTGTMDKQSIRMIRTRYDVTYRNIYN